MAYQQQQANVNRQIAWTKKYVGANMDQEQTDRHHITAHPTNSRIANRFHQNKSKRTTVYKQ